MHKRLPEVRIHITITLLLVIVSMLFEFSDIFATPSPVEAVTSESIPGTHDNSDYSILNNTDPLFVHRGDWERPDILLVVEDFDWQESLIKIIDASYLDGVPAYVLSDRDNIQSDDYLYNLVTAYNAIILRVSFDTPWIRDYGPLQIKSQKSSFHWLDFKYSGERPDDDLFPQQLAQFLNIPVESGDYYLDGGALISNGKGLCAITDKSLEESSVDQDSSEEFSVFKHRLGCRTLVVLPALSGETTGHADIIAQFLSPNIAAVSIVGQDIAPEVSDELNRAAENLIGAARATGQKLHIIRVPMHIEGDRFYSYVNGTRLKDRYLVPSFLNVPVHREQQAFQAISSAIPGIALTPVPADNIVKRGGAIHCITLGLNVPRYPYVSSSPIVEDKHTSQSAGFLQTSQLINPDGL